MVEIRRSRWKVLRGNLRFSMHIVLSCVYFLAPVSAIALAVILAFQKVPDKRLLAWVFTLGALFCVSAAYRMRYSLRRGTCQDNKRTTEAYPDIILCLIFFVISAAAYVVSLRYTN